MMSTMSPYYCERQAQAAMSMALAATGYDKQKWVRVAVAWYHLARNAADHDRALRSARRGFAPVERPADSSVGAAVSTIVSVIPVPAQQKPGIA
jgi:phage terminase Nu1 subunit (DNA packaging protein)